MVIGSSDRGQSFWWFGAAAPSRGAGHRAREPRIGQRAGGPEGGVDAFGAAVAAGVRREAGADPTAAGPPPVTCGPVEAGITDWGTAEPPAGAGLDPDDDEPPALVVGTPGAAVDEPGVEPPPDPAPEGGVDEEPRLISGVPPSPLGVESACGFMPEVA